MKLRRDGWYTADKGKHFVLTEKGKAESATYRNMTVGKPTSEYDTEAVHWDIENKHLIEVDIPDWIVKTGYMVGYDYNEYFLTAGNPVVFPERILAENYMKHYKNYKWCDHDLYIKETIYEGRALKPCKEHNGKQIYNMDLTNALQSLMSLFVEHISTLSADITSVIKSKVTEWIASQAVFIQILPV